MRVQDAFDSAMRPASCCYLFAHYITLLPSRVSPANLHYKCRWCYHRFAYTLWRRWRIISAPLSNPLLACYPPRSYACARVCVREREKSVYDRVHGRVIRNEPVIALIITPTPFPFPVSRCLLFRQVLQPGWKCYIREQQFVEKKERN